MTNEVAEKFIEISKDFTWDEFRILTDSYSPQPLPGAVVNKPVEIAGVRCEFIASTAVSQRCPATVPTSPSSLFFHPPPKLIVSWNMQVLFFHGGGFCIGSITSYRFALTFFSKITNLRFLAVEYSLSPESRYPTALNEGLEVLFRPLLLPFFS